LKEVYRRANLVSEKMYAFDPLYGKWELDSFIVSLISTAEVQRLRDIRLSNINSLFLPGSANVSRFEHSLGVAYLAEKVAKKRFFSSKDRFNLVAAGLLHDIGMPPFGHSVEFLLKKNGFNHEKTSSDLIRGLYYEKRDYIEQFSFCGRLPEIYNILANEYNEEADVEEIARIVEGKSRLSKLIKGSMDLDNIDSVYRMIHHTGMQKSCDPETIVFNFNKRGEDICFNEEGIKYIEQWNEDRAQLYSELLRNQADCQAKAMLSHVTTLAFETGILDERCWKLTESEFIIKLLDSDNLRIRQIMKDFLSGRLYSVVGRFLLEDETARKLLPIVQGNRQVLQTELQELIESRMRIDETIGKKRGFDIIIDMVSAAERRGVANLTFLPNDLLATATAKSVDKSLTRWILGVYTPRRIEEKDSEYVMSICRDELSKKLALDLRPLDGINKRVMN
jgi:uncharacterized protein